ncbi:hypothetical protein [Streptomyces sp. NE06-03C]|uniref:hypothetical protein n=1 Tax=Streptomyces sp. NE06-03C TaxID=3028694 RepID=UPI0029AED705|nr:hypothetical protein [Streptomyces sp. NE06-03C]MDX2922073.1 hypothetical protein [Streptomyces sp. NE06-03C]
MGPVEDAVRSDVEQLGDLVSIEPSLSEMAYTLAHQIDLASTGECEGCGEAIPRGDDGRTLPQLNRELRQTLAQLLEGRAADDDDDLGDLAAPD